jgi:4-phosphopantoate--beta-alanine ligase
MIPKSHPRFKSLMTREKIVEGIENGITGINGMIAQGRGEAFDYLIGEETTKSALHAEKVTAAMLLLAKRPVLSVNGNVAALVPEEIIRLSDFVKAPLEVNLFYRTEERVKKIIEFLQSLGAGNMRTKSDALIPGLEHERAKVDKDGIFQADVILVPLEDGDRCKALVDMKKMVISVDLNPLSRTAQSAQVTVVDNVVRAIPTILKFAQELKYQDKHDLQRLIDDFDNKKNLDTAIDEIIARLLSLQEQNRK